MNKRVDGLNFIRIIGMTMILFFHARLMYGFHTGIGWVDELISIGAVFVTVFFMLSGFGLRKSNRDLSVRDFSGVLKYYKKRIMSIYPLFFLLSVVALAFQFRVMDSWGETLARLPIQFSMLHILFGKEMHWFLFNDNCWYISALFVLYLLFPLLNELLNKLRMQMRVCLCVVLWLVSMGIYFYLVYCTELVFLDYYPNPFLRIPEFMIGMMLADLSKDMSGVLSKNMTDKDVEVWKRAGVIVLCTSLFGAVGLMLFRPYFLFETNLYNVIVIPCTAIIFLCVANWDWMNRVGKTKLVRWMAGLGLEVYLCQSFATLVLEYVKVDAKWDELAFIGLSVVFAVGVNTARKVLKESLEKKLRGLRPSHIYLNDFRLCFRCISNCD